jgi:hypothetical protein
VESQFVDAFSEPTSMWKSCLQHLHARNRSYRCGWPVRPVAGDPDGKPNGCPGGTLLGAGAPLVVLPIFVGEPKSTLTRNVLNPLGLPELPPSCMWILDVTFSANWIRVLVTLFCIFCFGPRSFITLCFGPRPFWSFVHLVSTLMLGFFILSKCASWTLPESTPFSAIILCEHKHYKTTFKCELVMLRALISLVWISN